MTTDQRATYAQVLAQPVFRTVFCTRILGIAADTLRMVALSTLIFAATGSPLLAAVAFGIGFVPQAVGVVGLGALADRLRPRGLVVGGYALEASAALTLVVWHPPVAAMLLIVACVALFTPVFAGATNRLIAASLTGDAYVLGRSLATVASSAAQLLGLAVGAAAVALLSPVGALLVTAGAHALAAAWSRVGLPPDPARHEPVQGDPARHEPVQGDSALSPAEPGPVSSPAGPGSVPSPAEPGGAGTVRDSWAGTRALLADRPVRTLLLAQWLPPAVVTGAEALLVPYAERGGFPAGAAGALLACSPLGMMLGDVAVARLLAPATRERLVVPLVALLGVPLLAFAAQPRLPVAAVLLILAGAGYAYSLGLQRRFLDAVPEPRRGHAFGLLAAGAMTCQGLGPVLFGLLAEAVSIGAAIALAGATVLALAAALRPALRRAA